MRSRPGKIQYFVQEYLPELMPSDDGVCPPETLFRHANALVGRMLQKALVFEAVNHLAGGNGGNTKTARNERHWNRNCCG